MREFLPVTLPFFLEDLQAAHLLGSHVAPRNAEVGRIELQFKHPFEEPAGD